MCPQATQWPACRPAPWETYPEPAGMTLQTITPIKPIIPNQINTKQQREPNRTPQLEIERMKNSDEPCDRCRGMRPYSEPVISRFTRLARLCGDLGATQ